MWFIKPARALEGVGAGFAHVARNRPGLGGAPGKRVERGDSPVLGQDCAGHLQMIGARPAFHEQCRNEVAGRVGAPLACERLTVSFLICGRACSRSLVQVNQPDQAVSDLAQGAPEIGE